MSELENSCQAFGVKEWNETLICHSRNILTPEGPVLSNVFNCQLPGDQAMNKEFR